MANKYYYNLENIISNNNKDYNYKDYNYVYKKDTLKDYIDVYSIRDLEKSNSAQYPAYSSVSPINWGSTAPRVGSQNAYVQPTETEIQAVLEAMHLVQELPEAQQRQLAEATQEVRYFFDGQVRAKFGATQHFNAIRSLNNPEATEVESTLSIPRSQLAGEEFFALNRFIPNYADIADIQWWSVYRNGSWRLDTWNPEGEHLDTGVNGWGELVGSVMKLNGQVLNPQEMIAFYRAIRLRNDRGFMNEESLQSVQTLLKALDTESSLPRRYEEQLETAHDLGLVNVDGRTLTYTGRSMITTVTARQRKARQISETDQEARRIIVPTIFN